MKKPQKYVSPKLPYLEWTAKLSKPEIRIMIKHGWEKTAEHGKFVTLVFKGTK